MHSLEFSTSVIDQKDIGGIQITSPPLIPCSGTHQAPIFEAKVKTLFKAPGDAAEVTNRNPMPGAIESWSWSY
jgi:hypothetical protein